MMLKIKWLKLENDIIKILIWNEEGVLYVIIVKTELIYSWTRDTWIPGFKLLAKGNGIYDMLVQGLKLPNLPWWFPV